MSYRTTSLITSAIELPSSEKRMSICLLPNGFSFSIISTKDVLLTVGETVYEGDHSLTDIANSIKGYFEGLNIYTFGFAQLQLVIPSEYSAWIPNELYDANNHRRYLNLVGLQNADLGIYAHANALIDAQMVFAADSTMVAAFKIALPGITVTNQHDVIVGDTMRQLSSNCAIMLMNIREGFIDVCALDQSQLLLSNTYPIKNDTDLQYQSIEVMKKMGLETPTMQLLLCGDVSRERYALLRNYFPTVKLFTGRTLSFGNPEMQHLHTYRYALNLL